MTTGLIVESALKASLTLGAAWIVTLAMRRASAASRHMIWMTAIVVTVAMPLLVRLAPRWRTLPEFRFVVDTTGVSTVPESFNLIPAIWLAGALLTLAAFAVGYARVALTVRRSRHAGEFRETAEAVSPFVWGTSVVLPEAARDWNEDLRRSVFLHEREHIARGDAAWLLISQIACAAYWFLPLAWFAMRKAREEAERACDDAVLRSGKVSVDYAGELLTVARGTLAQRMVPAVTGASPLERRVRSLLDSRVDRRRLSMRFSMVILAACVALAIPVAALQQDDKVHSLKEDKSIVPPKLTSKVEPEYTEEARDAKIEGVCVLAVEIDQDGIARNIVIKRSLDAGLDLNAIAAISKWRFSPAEKDGKPVRVAATIEVNFKLI